MLGLLAFIPGAGPFLAIGGFLAKNWKLLLIAASAIAIGLFVWSWDHRGKEAAILAQQNAVLQGNVNVLDQEAQQSRQADKEAAAHIAAAAQSKARYDHIAEEALREDSKNDASIAPVLRDALRSLGSLRGAPSSR